MNGNTRDDDDEGPDLRFWLEMAAATIGAFLAVTTIGFIVWRGLGEAGAPPVLAVELVRILDQPGGYLAEVVVTNRGERAAANVLVEGTVEADAATGEAETAEFTLDYVPSHSEKRGGLLFARDPSAGTLTLGAKGYAEP